MFKGVGTAVNPMGPQYRFSPKHFVSPQRRDAYPDVVTEARCRCTGCIGVDGLSQCEPVYYNIHVLRQTGQCDDDGFHKWESGWVTISVGCTCARKPTV